MKTVGDIVREVDGVELRRGNRDTELVGIAHDSRRVEPGGLFVAMVGARVDGHDYIEAAVEAGAAAVLVDRDVEDIDADAGVAVLEAEDTRRVLGPLASWFFDHPSRAIDVIGVTGTNGKTSTSYLLEQIFATAGRTPGIVGTVEYRWPGRRIEAPNTTPDGLVLQRTLRQMVDDGVDVAILEVSSHGLEMGRVAGTSFALGIFTNLSREHLDFHNSFDAYRRAKWRLFDQFLPVSQPPGRRQPTAVVNIDGEEGRKLADHIAGVDGVSVTTVSTTTDEGAGADHLLARPVEVTLEGIKLNLEHGERPGMSMRIPLPGRFHAENAAGAVAAAQILGVQRQDIRRGLASCTEIPGRMQRVGADMEGPAVFVDYAHTPDALKQALATLRPLTDGRLWVVFGAGGDRDVSKRQPMGRVAALGADRLVVTSDNPRSEPPDRIIDDIMEGIGDGESSSQLQCWWSRQPDRRKAIEAAVFEAESSDVILIAGKGHETYQEQQGRRRQFDDREVARNVLRRRGEGQ